MDRRTPRRLSRRAAVAAVTVVAACIHAHGGHPGSPCGREIRGSENITAPWTIALIGETHGTVEGPAAFARIVCRAAERSHPHTVLVGLEISRAEQSAIDAALADADLASARARLLAMPHFADDSHDGRDSEAMLALLLELRRQRRAGMAVEVLAFDVDPSAMTATTDSDASMAAQLDAAIEGHPEATVLVYAGSAHTRRRAGPGERGAPMAAVLQVDQPDLIALGFASAGGSYWGCPATLDCRAHPLEGRDRGAEPFVELSPTSDGTYDGVLYVGPITASPPADGD